jgi:hypothetical protein
MLLDEARVAAIELSLLGAGGRLRMRTAALSFHLRQPRRWPELHLEPQILNEI